MALVAPARQAYPGLAMHGPLQLNEVSPETFPYRPASHGPLHAAVVSPDDAPYSPALQFAHALAPPREN